MGQTEVRTNRGGLLLVEDNEADILFFRRALSKVREGVPLDVVTNGVAAVEALSLKEPERLPSIVLLDLKLPRMSGLEVLEWMRTQPPLNSVRTVVLTFARILDEGHAAGVFRKVNPILAYLSVVGPLIFNAARERVAAQPGRQDQDLPMLVSIPHDELIAHVQETARRMLAP